MAAYEKAPLKFCIAGTGAMGLEHIRNICLLKDRGCTIVAVADSDARGMREARETLDTCGFEDCKVFDDWHALFGCGADALIICTPNYQHVEGLVAKHCHGGKPCFMVGMEYRWMPPIAKLVETVDSKKLGATKMVSIREHRFPFLHKVGHWNRFNKWTGGTLVEKACHFFDLMRRLVQDDVVSVCASGGGGVNHQDESYDGEKPDILDFALVIVTYASGATSALDLCMFAEDMQTEAVSVVGTLGKAEAKCPECTFRVEHVGVDDKIKAAGFHEGATYFELGAFATAAAHGLDVPVSVRDGTMAVAMGAAAHLSLAEGRKVDLAEILPGYAPKAQ
ncbi:D-xylose 1-dehydrogenase [Aureococcus anophagefferens]|nr:D-xylose 1-dehydrogenase [Aureococcus anophagefferens]